MRDIPRNRQYVVPHAVVDAITTYLRGRAFKTVHYIGYADEGLMRSLIREARYKLSVMDYWDRYHTSDAFWGDVGDPSEVPRPDWLEGIPFAIEGAPPHNVLLQDIPWLAGQLDNLIPTSAAQTAAHQMQGRDDGKTKRVALRRRRDGPLCIILFGDAKMDTYHPRFEWARFSVASHRAEKT